MFDAPVEIYQCPIEAGLKAMDWFPVQGIDNKQADEIDTLLKGNPYSENFAVDRSRLHESEEAWIYISIEADGVLYSGFENCSGILVWNNSD